MQLTRMPRGASMRCRRGQGQTNDPRFGGGNGLVVGKAYAGGSRRNEDN